MANTRISELPEAPDLAGVVLAGVQSGSNVKVPAALFGTSGGIVESVVAGDNITVDATDPANPIVNATGGGNFVADIAALKALDTSSVTDAYLTQSGRAGQFIFRAGDYSAQVTADTEEGVYIEADDTASTSGVWVRVFDRLSAEFFGASTGATRSENAAALQGAVDIAQLYTGELFLPNLYLTDATITVANNIRLHGVSAKQSGISNDDGAAISLVPSGSISNNNTWYGFFNFSAIATDGVSDGISYVTSGSEYLSNWIMEGVYASGVRGALFDSSGSTVGIFSCTIRRNWFDNGLSMVDVGDSVTILENTCNGEGTGIEVDGAKSGARQLVIRNNNLTTLSECLHIKDIVGAIVDSNWMETPYYLGNYTGTSDAIVWLENCTNTRFYRNTVQPLDEVGGGFVGADYAITVTGTGAGNFIDDNDIADGVVGHINVVGSSVTDTWIGWRNRYAETAVITDTGATTIIESQASGIRRFATSQQFIAPFAIECTHDGSGNGPNFEIFRNSPSPAALDGLGGVLWFGQNSAGEKINYAYFTATLVDPTDGSEDGRINMNRMVNGTLIEGFTVSDTFRVNTSTIQPNVDDGTALGTTSFKFSDLFLASGAVINFAAGNYTITHTSGVLTFNGAVRSSGQTGGVGYATGAGSTVTQITSRTTGVTLNRVCGQITMFSAAGSTTAASFTVTNSAVAATDVIVLNQASGTNLYELLVTTVSAGSFVVTFRTTGGTSSDAPVINFAVIKAVAA